MSVPLCQNLAVVPIHPEGTSKDSDICDTCQRILTSFCNGVYGEFLRGDKVEVMTGLWVDPTQK